MRNCSIGTLAKEVDLSIDTLRYYEKLGLVKQPSRLQSGYRSYTQDSRDRFLFIKWAKTLGFTLNEIKIMLNIKDSNFDTCERIKTQAAEKLEIIDKKISDLKKLRKTLKAIVLTCEETPGDKCSVLKNFEVNK